MGINPYVRPQQQKEESDTDKILKGLQVAGQLYGLYTDTTKVAQMKKDNELKDAQIKEARAQYLEKSAIDKARELREQEKFEAEKASGFGVNDKALDRQVKLQNYEKNQRDLKNPLTQDKVLKVNEGAAIPRTLEDIEKTVEANKEAFGPFVGRVRSINPYDTKAATMDAQMRAASQQFGRFMEGGVLRKEDEDKYRKMFPQLSDTPEVAANKLAIVKRLMTQKQESDVSALGDAGYDVGAFKNTAPVSDLPEVLKGSNKESPLAAGVAGIKGPKAPKIGEVKNGYQYKGGDPADKNSWVKK